MRLTAAFVVLCAAGILAADDTKKDDADAIKGKWMALSISVGGEPQADDARLRRRVEAEHDHGSSTSI